VAVDVAAEVAEAEALGLPPEQIVAIAKPQSNIDGQSLTYIVPDADKESWRPAWRMEKGWDGLEYGKPMKLPKNTNALAIYLAKRRMDGGRLFTLTMPERILGPGELQCFAAPEFCQKKLDSKGKLVDHIEGKHPAEARNYAPFIKQIRDSIAGDNPALQAMVDKIASSPDHGNAVETPAEIREQHDATVPVIAPMAAPEIFTVTPKCELCPWPVGSEKWANQPPSAVALKMHIFAKHKEEIE